MEDYAILEDNQIALSKDSLQFYIDYYKNLAKEYNTKEQLNMRMYYIGRADSLIEIIKLFEDEE